MDYKWKDIAYPLFVGVSWKHCKYCLGGLKLKSLHKTVKTPAGTFRNVIEIEIIEDMDYFYTYYYARNVGCIKLVHDGETILELQQMKKR